MVKWSGKGKYPREQERERLRMLKETREHREHQRRLQALKDLYDLYGEDAIVDPEDKILFVKHYGFFLGEG